MLKLLITINILLLTGQIILSLNRATQGTQLGSLQSRAQMLATENQRIREAIYTSSSLSHIWTLAEGLNLQSHPVSFLNHLPVAAARP